MKKIYILFLAMSVSIVASAIEPTKSVLLYPKGQEVDLGIIENGVKITEGPLVSNGLKGDKYITFDWRYQQVANGAMIDIYLPEYCNGQMIVVCPGGGYGNVCSGHEGRQVAEWALARRIAVCVVIYRLPNHHHQVPLQDVQNAFRYCRYHAAEWGIRQIGVLGFSAGGHLAASASTLWKDDITRPDFSVLIYPVIDFVHSGHSGTCKNLLPEGDDPVLKEYYSLNNRVNSRTPKTILLLSQNDKSVKPANSISYFERLLENGVESEIHIFTSGGHGWGFGGRYAKTDGVVHPVPDGLSAGQREDFDRILSRWLSNRLSEIPE